MRRLQAAGYENIVTRTHHELDLRNQAAYEGDLVFDDSKPDGTPRKLLDVSRLREVGWTAKTSLREGIEESYKWYLENVATQELTS